MRKLILQMQMSVDGRVAAHNGEPWQLWNWGDDWTWDTALKRDFNATFDGIGTILLSRPMVEQGYLDHWARMVKVLAADPHGGFARRIGEVDKVVLSDNLRASLWPRTTVMRGPIDRAINALKETAAGDILCFGGTGFATALAAAGVVDELHLYVNPTAVGSGDTIFCSMVPLRLLVSNAYDCGLVVRRYAVRSERANRKT